MLNIYNRSKQLVGALQTKGYYQDVAEVTVSRRLNSDYTLSFQLAMQSSKYPLLEKEGLVECEGQKYVVKESFRKREGMGRTVQFNCQHIMQRLRDIHIPYSSAQAEALGKDISFFTDIISNATGGVFTFTVMDTIPVKDVYKWGYSNCLKAFQDLITLYDVEFVPDNYNIKIYSKISVDNGAQYRIGKNILNNSFNDNTKTLCTRMTGLAKDSLTIIDLPSSYLTADELSRLNAVSGAIVNGVIKVPYLISQYQSSWATPDNAYFDSNFTDTNIDASTEAGKAQLLGEIRKKLAASEIPDIQIQIDAADVWKIGSGERPTIGETVYLIDPDMQMNNITARVMELTEYPFDPSKNTSVTLANYLLKDMNDIVSDLRSSKEVLDGILTNKSVNTSFFEAATKQAIDDINNSKTQVIYDTRGIVLQDQTNPLDQVVMSSAGIYITEDGGTTTKAAILAGKIVAEQIVGILGQFAQVKTDNLIAGTALIGSALIDKIKANQIDVSSGKIIAAQIDATNLQVAAANITGTLTAAQIDATNLHVSSANIDGTITADTVKSSWVYAGSLSAAQVNAVAISADSITSGSLIGRTVKTAASGTRVELSSGFADINLYHSTLNILQISDIGDGTVRLLNPNAAMILGETGYNVSGRGSWTFHDTVTFNGTVNGLNVTAKFA